MFCLSKKMQSFLPLLRFLDFFDPHIFHEQIQLDIFSRSTQQNHLYLKNKSYKHLSDHIKIATANCESRKSIGHQVFVRSSISFLLSYS